LNNWEIFGFNKKGQDRAGTLHPRGIPCCEEQPLNNRESPGHKDEEQIMRHRITVSLVGLLLLVAAPAWAAKLAPTTENLVKVLGDCGYEYKEMRGNKAILTGKQSVVSVSLNDKGLIYEGGLSIGPKADVDSTLAALYAIYTTLQVNKGKTQMLNDKVAAAKMTKLIDAVEAALKVSSRTQFRFEDMDVLATKNDKTQYFTIGLKPRG
jgi:hypothetical protein